MCLKPMNTWNHCPIDQFGPIWQGTRLAELHRRMHRERDVGTREGEDGKGEKGATVRRKTVVSKGVNVNVTSMHIDGKSYRIYKYFAIVSSARSAAPIIFPSVALVRFDISRSSSFRRCRSSVLERDRARSRDAPAYCEQLVHGDWRAGHLIST